MVMNPRACWFAAIRGAQKVKDVEDCLKNTAAPPLKYLGMAVPIIGTAVLHAQVLVLLFPQKLYFSKKLKTCPARAPEVFS